MTVKYRQTVERVIKLPADGHDLLLLKYTACGRWRPPFYHIAHRQGPTVHVLGRVGWLTGRLCFAAMVRTLKEIP